MEKNKFKSGCVKRAAARRFFLLLSSGRYVFSISGLMITVPACKQMNFCLRNCKLTKKAGDFVLKPPALYELNLLCADRINNGHLSYSLDWPIHGQNYRKRDNYEDNA